MTEKAPGFEVKFEKVKEAEVAQYHRSNTICAVVYFTLVATGLPAVMLSHLWVQLNVAAILHIQNVSSTQVFQLAYIFCLASMVPVLMLLFSSFMGKKIDHFGSSFSVGPEGICWKAKDLATALSFELLRLPRKTVPWEKILLVSYVELASSIKKEYLPDRIVRVDWLMSTCNICFWGEKTPGGPVSCLFRVCLLSLDQDTRHRLMAAIKNFAPHVIFTKGAHETLMGPVAKERDVKYTEIWLKLLNAERNCRVRESELAPGDRLDEGRYEVVRKLATGGQANLYLANDLQKTPVVLKEYIVSSVNDESIMNGLVEFETESDIMQRVDHQNICKLQNMFVDDGRAYLVLNYVEGESLRTHVENHGKLSEADAVDFVSQLCNAVAYLHSLDPIVIHRDISPDNLILKNGEITLIDFSVASSTQSDKIGQVVGKPSYMSIEQFRGFSRASNDIYSIGATAYYLLTGEDPSPVSESHPRQLSSELSESIDEFVALCTSSQDGVRFEKIEAAIAYLEQLRSSSSLVY